MIGIQDLADPLSKIGSGIVSPGLEFRMLRDFFTDVRLTCKVHDRFGDRIVHVRIEFVALHPFGRKGPNLADDISLWVNRTDSSAELFPKSRRLDLTRDVQSPAVDFIFPNPEFGNPHDVFPDLWMVGIEFG